MKLKGPVHKAPPIAETRKKLCSEAPSNSTKRSCISYWRSSRIYFQNSSRRAGLQNGRSNLRLKSRKGLVPPNKPPYRLSPKEHDELDSSDRRPTRLEDISALCKAPTGALVLFVPKKDGRWRMCVDYHALNKANNQRQIPVATN